jgi:hypothetical protein
MQLPAHQARFGTASSLRIAVTATTESSLGYRQDPYTFPTAQIEFLHPTSYRSTANPAQLSEPAQLNPCSDRWRGKLLLGFLSPFRATSMSSWLLISLRLLWASPNSLLGLLCGLGGLLTGGRMQWRRGCLEFYGGVVSWGLARTPISAAALTLGHTILGRDHLALEMSREHEHVHVRQYAVWGPLFLPAYLGSSLVLWLRGKHPYWDNPFEREAYGSTPSLRH